MKCSVTLLLLLAACASRPCADVTQSELTQLTRLADEDQAARAAHLIWSREHADEAPPVELVLAVEEADARSRAFLGRWIEAGRWPCISQVGAEAAQDAWLLVQHADRDPDLQRRALDLMDRLVDEGEVAAGNHALLTDRVLVAEGRPQRFGTQWRIEQVGGVLHFGPATPIEDRDSVDERREAVGLTSLAEYSAHLRQLYGVPEDAPGFE
ncbi:MAG: hypothetical protein O2816_04230 [Planctomycetota bacterium]|nr:hypothetical protein [Planctomycetota bacterium]